MREQNTLKRLLELLINLSSGLRYSQHEIAARFGVSERTVFREIRDLREVGFVIPEPWENEKEHKALPIDVFRISSCKRIKVRLKLSMRATELLKEEYPLSEEFISHLND